MRSYYELTKPGIVYGNAMTALAAFLFATHSAVRLFQLPLLAATLLGLSLAIASACVINNIMDRKLDVHMERTKNRALPTGKVSVRSAYFFAIILFALGFGALYIFTNLYAVFITLLGVIVYLGLYTPAKRFTKHSTIIGAFAGAVPPVVGYVAVTNSLDQIAVVLFLILVCWQMTHFFAIAIFRSKDYAQAEMPVMPNSLGVERTKVLMVVYALLFTASAGALAFKAQLGLLYSIPMSIVCAGWIAIGLSGIRHNPNLQRWARAMFFYSLAALMVFSVVLALCQING